MSLLGHALAVGFDFEIKISFHVTSARPPQGSVECVVAGSCARVGYLPCPLVEQASQCPYWDMFMLLFLISR
jgi:hypothetical protein